MTHRNRDRRGRRSVARRNVARRHAVRQPASGDALAAAIEHDDWERAALLLLLGVSAVARSLPEGQIDDVLALLDGEEARG
ncbi:MAG: hypothetical protein HY873_06275 [Chloroflexi bacterium]|nr:hypothetical protein [Chloroflexota bacterium]